ALHRVCHSGAAGPYPLSGVSVAHFVEVAVERGNNIAVDVPEPHHLRPRTLDGANELVQLQLDRTSVSVLGVLDQEQHQEGDDRRGRVDDQLPRVGIAKSRPEQSPHTDHGAGPQEHLSRSDEFGATASKLSKLFVHIGVVEHGLCHARYVIPLRHFFTVCLARAFSAASPDSLTDGGCVFYYLRGRSMCRLPLPAASDSA